MVIPLESHMATSMYEDTERDPAGKRTVLDITSSHPSQEYAVRTP